MASPVSLSFSSFLSSFVKQEERKNGMMGEVGKLVENKKKKREREMAGEKDNGANSVAASISEPVSLSLSLPFS